jgi:short-subunit dehydrogenase
MEIHDWVLGNNFTIDILVNNAGFGIYGAFAEADPSIIQQLMQVNMASVTSLIRLFLDDMLRRKSGRILNVASTAAFQPGPMMAIYYASKAYVLFLSEALSNELRGTGVTVTALCPGPTRTQFQKRAGIERSNLLRFGMMDARKVAELGYSGMVQGKTIVIPGLLNRMLAQAVRFIPRPAAAALVRRVQEGRNGSK